MHGSHRVAREEGNVGAADPVQGEALVETHGVLEGDQVVHQALADLPLGQTAAIDAEGLGDHLEAFRRGAVVERHHVFDQRRVAQAVGQVEIAAEAVRHGMHRAEDGVGEGQPGLHAPEHDLLAQGDVAGVGDHLYQIAIDQAHRFQRVGIGQRPVAGGDERLDGVYQCIDAGTGGKEGIHGQRGFRVDQRDVRHNRLAHHGELHALVLVGNDHELRDVRRSPGGGRDQDQRRTRHPQPVDAFELEDAAAMGGDDADALGAIHRAAAAHRDDHVAALAAIELGAEHHLVDPGVGRNVGIQAVVDALSLQACLDVGDPAGGEHAGVGDQQDLARTEGLHVVGDAVPAAGAEDDLGRDEFTQLAEVVAHLTDHSYCYRTLPAAYCIRRLLQCDLGGSFQSSSKPR